jgi:1,4-dihydroxy-2-naphthoate octaprenyltransferase
MAMSKTLSGWLMAARPFSLSLSIVPVAVGAALAWAAARNVNGAAVSVALIGAVLIHIGANIHNDTLDAAPGADRVERFGPPRATARGLLSAGAVRRGAALSFALAALAGCYLVWVGGWPILALGLASIAAGWAYSGGPRPIAHSPLGEFFVVVFFGLGAVGGTYWLCTLQLSAAALAGGLALGCFAAAVLAVNNYRDVEVDRRAGRLTLPMVIGARATIALYALFMLAPFALLPAIARGLPHGSAWPALLAVAPALWLIARFAGAPRDRGLNRILLGTVEVQILYAALLAAGLVLVG